MNFNNNRFSSLTSLSAVHRENENLVLEPLLSSKQQIKKSTNDLLVSGEQRNFRNACLMYISRINKLCCSMSIRSPTVFCFEAIKWIPVIFILGVISWSYYAYVVQMCIFTIDYIPKKVIYLCIYHVLLILVLWCYYRTVFKYYIGPSRQFYVGEIEGDRLATAQTVDERRSALVRLSREANLDLLTRHVDGSIRYCFVCQCIKPDRAHHCSVCAKCVLRYDHHCPWTNSCISFGNYKFFILFLGWTLLFCIFVAATSFQYFLLFWQNTSNIDKNENRLLSKSERINLLFLFFIAIIFAISISSLFFYHLYLIAKNRTTVESYRAPIFANGPQKYGFDLGWKKNYQEIFGTNIFIALLPIFSTQGNGVHYQINNSLIEDLQQQSRNATYVVHSMVTTNQHSNNNNNSNNNNATSTLNGSSDVLLPLDNPSNSIDYDHHYLLSGHNNGR